MIFVPHTTPGVTFKLSNKDVFILIKISSRFCHEIYSRRVTDNLRIYIKERKNERAI